MPPRRNTTRATTMDTNDPEFCNELFARVIERPSGNNEQIRNPRTNILINPFGETYRRLFNDCRNRNEINYIKAWSEFALSHYHRNIYLNNASDNDIRMRNRILRNYRRDHPYAGTERNTYNTGPPSSRSSSSSPQNTATETETTNTTTTANDSIYARILAQIYNGIFRNILWPARAH